MYLLVKYLIEAGVPANVLQLVHLKPEDNPKFLDALLATGAIKKINFTGSTLIGKKIASTAAKYLVPVYWSWVARMFQLFVKMLILQKLWAI